MRRRSVWRRVVHRQVSRSERLFRSTATAVPTMSPIEKTILWTLIFACVASLTIANLGI